MQHRPPQQLKTFRRKEICHLYYIADEKWRQRVGGQGGGQNIYYKLYFTDGTTKVQIRSIQLFLFFIWGLGESQDVGALISRNQSIPLVNISKIEIYTVHSCYRTYHGIIMTGTVYGCNVLGFGPYSIPFSLISMSLHCLICEMEKSRYAFQCCFQIYEMKKS